MEKMRGHGRKFNDKTPKATPKFLDSAAGTFHTPHRIQMPEEIDSPPPNRTDAPARKPLLAPLLAAIPLMFVFLTLPIAPIDLDVDPDPSFSLAVNDGRLQGLHLGTDLVHTYGPLGYLIFIYYAPQIAFVRTVCDVILSFAFASGVCLVAWRLGWLVRLALLAVCAYISANVPHQMDLLVDIGSFCWGLLCCVESGRRLKAAAVVFVGLVAFAALGKNSMLFMGGLSLGLVALILGGRGHWRLALAMLLGFVAAIVLGWVTAGHGLANLRAAIVNAASIVSGYNQAMGWEVLPLALYAGLAVAPAALVMIAARSFGAVPGGSPRAPIERLLLFAWLGALLFLDWKHGFVRGDVWHVGYFFGFVPVFALALGALPSYHTNSTRLANGLAIGCSVVCLGIFQYQYLPSGARSLRAPLAAFTDHVRDLFYPRGYARRMNAALEDARKQTDLQALRDIVKDSPMDVFGQLQIYPLLNGLKYKPRPVFQSYVVYNAHLASLNETFFLSTNAPEYLLFCLSPTDRRFPTLEDPRLLRDALYNFQFVAETGPFLVLKRDTPAPISLTLERAGTVNAGEIIPLPPAGDTNLWLEIEVAPTFPGRVRQVLYRPATARLAAWKNGKVLLRRRAPPVMMAGGFLASPLLCGNSDMASYFNGGVPVRPDGYSVEIEPDQRSYWAPVIQYRLYRIENPPRRATPKPDENARQ
jgi:hypothetical protein